MTQRQHDAVGCPDSVGRVGVHRVGRQEEKNFKMDNFSTKMLQRRVTFFDCCRFLSGSLFARVLPSGLTDSSPGRGRFGAHVRLGKNTLKKISFTGPMFSR